MYTYLVGHWNYEDRVEIYLGHEDKFTQKQFSELVSNVSVDVMKELEEDEEMDFSDILDDVVEKLQNEFGFVPQNVTAYFVPEGYAPIFKENLSDTQLIKIQEKWEKKKSL